MVNASGGWAQAPPMEVPTAVSLVVRDMGNGVTRVLSVACIEGGVPPAVFYEVFRPAKVAFPLCEKLSDALACAALASGFDASRVYVDGYMRPLTEDITELLVW